MVDYFIATNFVFWPDGDPEPRGWVEGRFLTPCGLYRPAAQLWTGR